MSLCLVTGASGFTGGYLVEALLKKGERVRAFCRRRSDGSISRKLQELRNERFLTIIRGDVTDYHDVLEAMKGVRYVYHLASQSFVPDSVANPSYSFQTNVLGTSNILESARHCRANFGTNPRILFASSSEVYGKQEPRELPLDERSELRPASPYATSKVFGENLCRNYFENYGVETVVTRAFNHEGAGRGHHFVTASIVRQLVMMKKGETRELIVGNTAAERDWSHVKDIVKGYILIMEKGTLGEKYVLGSGQSYSIKEFISAVAFELKMDSEINTRIDPSLFRPADVPYLRSNPWKAVQLGWQPEFNLEDIVVEMVKYYEKMTPEERASI